MTAADLPTPIPGRASDADRRKIARLLQQHSTHGRLSRETFAMRVERALTARSRAELDDLVADVRDPGPLRRAAIAAVGWVSRLTADLCHLTEPSVSRRHAQLRRVDETWLLRDLGSSNGTRLNGIRLTEETEVRPGDQLNLGGVRYRLGGP